MNQLLLIGAGRSSSALVDYLKAHADDLNLQIKVADFSLKLAAEKVQDFERATAIKFDVNDSIQLNQEVGAADLVISMLPAHMHLPVAQSCVKHKKSLLTASYVSKGIKSLEEDAKAAGVMILMEMGLDPGIDHMSAKKEIDQIISNGGVIHSFKSFTGGLVAPESDNNPWNYKFTWNPRNVVLAGQGDVKFIRNGRYKYIPYHSLFKRIEEVTVEGYGDFEAYSNRDSLSYREHYDLQDIPTIFRGTLRRQGFCEAWDSFVQLGMTSDAYQVEDLGDLTWRDFLNAYLVYDKDKSVEEKLAAFLKVPLDHVILKKIEWLGLFKRERIGMDSGTPAQVLQKLLESKWSLEPHDKDMIVMQHQFEYSVDQKRQSLTSSLVVKGDDAKNTSMAKTVGLPLAIATRLFFENKINLTGVHIPTIPELYTPILKELDSYGVKFTSSINQLN